jgi:hypothetical protein
VLVNLLGRTDLTGLQKVVWAVVALVWGIGPILYVLVGGGDMWCGPAARLSSPRVVATVRRRYALTHPSLRSGSGLGGASAASASALLAHAYRRVRCDAQRFLAAAPPRRTCRHNSGRAQPRRRTARRSARRRSGTRLPTRPARPRPR